MQRILIIIIPGPVSHFQSDLIFFLETSGPKTQRSIDKDTVTQGEYRSIILLGLKTLDHELWKRPFALVELSEQ